jgi:hypothetical protein
MHDELKIKARVMAAAMFARPVGQSGGRAPQTAEWVCACCERRVKLSKGEQFPIYVCHPTDPATWTSAS